MEVRELEYVTLNDKVYEIKNIAKLKIEDYGEVGKYLAQKKRY